MKNPALLGISALFALCLSSCSNDEIATETVPEKIVNENQISLEDDKEFGTYNALGYGYDVTGEYANSNSVTLKVIDIDKFNTEQSTRLVDENVASQEYVEEYGEDAAAFSMMLSKKVKATEQLQLYGRTLSTPFNSAIINNHNLFDPKYIYGNYHVIIKQKRFRINATTEMLSDYVTQDFLQDLQSKTPQQIVHDYGTHVTTDIYTGAKIDVLFQAQTTNPDRQRAARAGIATLNPNTSNDIDILDASKNYAKKLYYKTRGGDKSKRFANIISFDQHPPKINISDWQSTSTKDNSVLIDFGSKGLVLIYDLVKDPLKKSQLKSYIDQYLINNQALLAQ